MALSFTDREDEILVDEVANHPSLYQINHALFRDSRIREELWTEIAVKVGKSVEHCKKRWKNIKDTYDRKHNRKNEPTSYLPKRGKKWALEEKLFFLRRGLDNSFSTVEPKEEYVDSNNDEQMPQTEMSTPPSASPAQYLLHSLPSTLEKTSNLKEKIIEGLLRIGAEKDEIMRTLLTEEPENDIDLFFKSIANTVKKLTPALQQQAKIETLNLITNLETQMWNNIQSDS